MKPDFARFAVILSSNFQKSEHFKTYAVVLRWGSIFIGTLPKSPLNKVILAEHERSMVSRVIAGEYPQWHEITKGHDPQPRTDTEMLTDPLLKLIKSHTMSPVKERIPIHEYMEDQDTETRKFGKKNHSGWDMGEDGEFEIFFATCVISLFYPLSNSHGVKKGTS